MANGGGGTYRNIVENVFTYVVRGARKVVSSSQMVTKSLFRQSQAVDRNTRSKQQNTQATQQNTQAQRGNRMEYGRWLGVGLSAMFISMQLSMVFRSMMRPVLEMTGLFEVWRATLKSVLAPVLVPLSMVLIDILTWFMDLPRPMKKAIGFFVVLGAVLTTVIQFASQFFLLFMSLGMGTLMQTGSITAAVAAGFRSFGNVFKWIGKLFTGNRQVIRQFGRGLGTVGRALGRIAATVGIVLGAFQALSGYMKGDFWDAFGGTLTVIAGIIALVVGGWIPALIAGLIGLFTWLGSKFEWLRKTIATLLSPLTALVTLIMGIVEFIKTGSITQGINKALGAFESNTFFRGVPQLADGGIVTKPTLAMIGEGGPEAVMPLNEEGGAGGGTNIQINIPNAQFTDRGQMNDLVRMIQSALRDELSRLGML